MGAAEAAGASVVRFRRGRAAQQNRGAEEAKGDVLVFLHADSTLPYGYLQSIKHAFCNTPGGAEW